MYVYESIYDTYILIIYKLYVRQGFSQQPRYKGGK